jgi:hypothetical protein
MNIYMDDIIDRIKDYVRSRALPVTHEVEDLIVAQITPIGELPVCLATMYHFEDSDWLQISLTDAQRIDAEAEAQVLSAVNRFNRDYSGPFGGVAVLSNPSRYLQLDISIQFEETDFYEESIGNLLINLYRSWLNLVEIIPNMGKLKAEFSKN